jgi:hypothetical protein
MEPMPWLDTFPRFLEVWSSRETVDPNSVRDLWLAYMASYPDLLQKQIDCYRGDELDWLSIAAERVYPFYLPTHL